MIPSLSSLNLLTAILSCIYVYPYLYLWVYVCMRVNKRNWSQRVKKKWKTFHLFELVLIEEDKLFFFSNSTYWKLPPTHRTATSGFVSLAWDKEDTWLDRYQMIVCSHILSTSNLRANLSSNFWRKEIKTPKPERKRVFKLLFSILKHLVKVSGYW